MNDFSPTKKDLFNIDERILEIKSKRNSLISSKINIQNSLSRLKENYKEVEYMGRQFKETKELRQHLKDEFNKIELELKSLNQEIIFKNKLRLEVEFYLKNNVNSNGNEDLVKIINKLSLLKVKYSEFAKDKTRVASLRIMASEFRDEIEKLIKK